MKNSLSYKGFSARVEFDADDNIFFGRVLGVEDIIGFHGETVKELTEDFHNAINHYLEVCIQRGEKPQKVYSGKITLRIPPKIHADIATAAANANTSLNKWVSTQLEQVVHVH